MNINQLVMENLFTEETFRVPKKKKKKVRDFNPKTNRMKNFKRNEYFETNIKPEDRTLKNIPRYKGNQKLPIVRFQEWLQIKKPSHLNDHHSYGKATNGKWYGWSHRAIGEFYVGKKVTDDTIGNEGGKSFTIKSDQQAQEMAKRFAKEVA